MPFPANLLASSQKTKSIPGETTTNLYKNPAVARMADHTAPVVKLTLTQILPGLRE